MNRRLLFSCLFYLSLHISPLVFAQDTQVRTIQKNETWDALSRNSGLSVETLQFFNPDLDKKNLAPGSQFLLPKTYRVKTGDTIYSLARTWNVAQSDLLRANSLKSTRDLKAGRLLAIPEKKAVRLVGPVELPPVRHDPATNALVYNIKDNDFRAVTAGVVVFLGDYGHFGNIVLIQDEDKILRGYGKFSECKVKLGQKVGKGEVLGKTGNRGAETLMYFAFKDGRSVDPLDL